MKPIYGLPRTATIRHNGYGPLIIENYRIIQGGSFLIRMIRFTEKHHLNLGWGDLTGQLERQGFQFNGVIEHCISELQNLTIFTWVIKHFYNTLIQDELIKLLRGVPWEMKSGQN